MPQTAACNSAYGTMHVLIHDARGAELIATGKAPDHGDILILSRMLREAKEDPVAVDAGANVGCFSLAFAKAGATVYAFEPQPVIADLLEQSVKKNGASVIVSRKALGAKPSRTMLPEIDYDEDRDFGMTKLGPNGKHTIEIMPLDALDLPRLDLLKIDTEGMELDVLTGATRTIERCRPAIFLEWTLSDQRRLAMTLAKLRYRVVARFAQDWLCQPCTQKQAIRFMLRVYTLDEGMRMLRVLRARHRLYRLLGIR